MHAQHITHGPSPQNWPITVLISHIRAGPYHTQMSAFNSMAVLHQPDNKCKMAGCNQIGTKLCASCMVNRYCSLKCQKDDWKSHKIVCSKKMPTAFLAVAEVAKIVKRSFDQAIGLKSLLKGDEAIAILETAVNFANDQFGERVKGGLHRVRKNGDVVDNWPSVNMPLCLVFMQLSNLLIETRTVGSYDKAYIYALEARALIEPQRKAMQCGELDYIHLFYFQIESVLAEVCTEKFLYEEAHQHCEECLSLAKKSKGEAKTSNLFEALKLTSSLLRAEGKIAEAVVMIEQAYITVSEVHGPDHPTVQEAAAELIECLIQNGQYSQAEGYSRVTYESLIDPSCGIDPNGEQVARGSQQLAHICMLMAQEDPEKSSHLLVESEVLIRKACGIMERLFGSKPNLAICLETLGQVLVARGLFDKGTRDIFERVLSIYMEAEEGRGRGTMLALVSLGEFLVDMSHVMPPGDARVRVRSEAVLTFSRAAVIAGDAFGDNHKRTISILAKVQELAAEMRKEDQS